MRDELIDNFILHPDWKEMEDYIVNHFMVETDVSNIDTTKDSSVIHAEVIARQRIALDIKSLQDSFETLKVKRSKKKISYE